MRESEREKSLVPKGANKTAPKDVRSKASRSEQVPQGCQADEFYERMMWREENTERKKKSKY